MKRILFAALACLAVAACGQSGLSGTYVPKGESLGGGFVMQKLDFVSGESVDVSMMEQTVRATYKIDGKKLLLIVNGQQEVFNITDDGCLDGGNLFGKFCRG